MRIRRAPTYWILAALSYWPLAYGILMIVLLMSPLREPAADPFVLLVHVLTIANILALAVFYSVDVVRNDAIPHSRQGGWIAALFLASVIAIPLYFARYGVKPEPSEKGS